MPVEHRQVPNTANNAKPTPQASPPDRGQQNLPHPAQNNQQARTPKNNQQANEQDSVPHPQQNTQQEEQPTQNAPRPNNPPAAHAAPTPHVNEPAQQATQHADNFLQTNEPANNRPAPKPHNDPPPMRRNRTLLLRKTLNPNRRPARPTSRRFPLHQKTTLPPDQRSSSGNHGLRRNRARPSRLPSRLFIRRRLPRNGNINPTDVCTCSPFPLCRGHRGDSCLSGDGTNPTMWGRLDRGKPV